MKPFIFLALIFTLLFIETALYAQEVQPNSHNLLAVEKFDPQSHQPIIITKFREGSGIRLRNGELASLSGVSTNELKSVLAGYADIVIKRLFTRPEAVLTEEKRSGELLSGKALADLNLFYKIYPGEQRDLENLLSSLRELDIVRIHLFSIEDCHLRATAYSPFHGKYNHA